MSDDIWVVEDNLDDFEMAVYALRTIGKLKNRLRLAPDGATALSYMAEGDVPLLILLDLGLPPPDGMVLLARIRNEARFDRVPILIMTASDDPADFERALRIGAQGYMRKPIEAERLFKAVLKLTELAWAVTSAKV